MSNIRQYGQMKKSRRGKSRRRGEKKKEAQTRERVRRKKIQVREKVEKLRSAVFSQCVVLLEAYTAGPDER